MVTYEVWINSWGIISISCEHINTFSKSSHSTSSAGVPIGDPGVFDCYELSPSRAEDSVLGQCVMAATRHFLAVTLHPQISRALPSEGNFTF